MPDIYPSDECDRVIHVMDCDATYTLEQHLVAAGFTVWVGSYDGNLAWFMHREQHKEIRRQVKNAGVRLDS